MKVPSNEGRSLEERPPDGSQFARRMVKVNEVLDLEVDSAEHGRVRATVAVAERPRHDVLWLAEQIVGGWGETLRVSLLVLVAAIAVIGVAVLATATVEPVLGIGGGVCATMIIVALQSRSRHRSLARHRVL